MNTLIIFKLAIIPVICSLRFTYCNLLPAFGCGKEINMAGQTTCRWEIITRDFIMCAFECCVVKAKRALYSNYFELCLP